MRQAMIFAAGLGTRLRPLTDTMPKALVPVGGEPLIGHVVERLRQAGFERVVVNVHHFPDQIIEYLESHPVEGMQFLVSDEREQLLETGGGLKKAAPLLDADSRVLVHNVDILSNADLCALYDAADSDATLLVSERETSRYLLFDDNMRLVGWTNVKTGEVKSPYATLRVEDCRRLAFSGIHVVAPSLLRLMEEWPPRFGIIDFYLSVCDRMVIRGVVQDRLRMLDVGKVDSLEKASDFEGELKRS
ncbi:MAG: nucleotidyltransferase family protein [Prevotella sp.]|nr:nucleotidyltransferase family protein [Prevotella sp.]